MDAMVTGETEEIVGASVIDNRDVEHVIDVRKEDGEITGHQQDGYPDKAAKRDPAGNEHVHQARQFARYYVFAERGYETVPNERSPEMLEAVRRAVASLSESKFVGYFGDLYQQLQSHQGDADRLIEIPSAAADPESVLYRKEVYLGVDPLATEYAEEAKSMAAQYDIDLSDDTPSDILLGDLSEDALDDWLAFADDFGRRAFEDEADLSGGVDIDAVSSLHVAYPDTAGREHVTEPETAPPIAADALIEIPPMEPGSLSEFQDYLNHNLACQIRDCFVRMGLEPPEPFQILGFGRFEAAQQYQRLEMYPNYIDPEEERAFAY